MVLVLMQKPFDSDTHRRKTLVIFAIHKISTNHWVNIIFWLKLWYNFLLFKHVRVFQLALFSTVIEVLWFYGITFCGPLRSILVFEQNSYTILAAIMGILKGGGSSARTRGIIFLIGGFVVLFLMDTDTSIYSSHGYYLYLNSEHEWVIYFSRRSQASDRIKPYFLSYIELVWDVGSHSRR